MNKILLIIVALIVALGAFILLGNKKTAPAISTQSTAQPTVIKTNNPITTITLSDTGFVPKDIIVKTGTRVIWVNKSGKTATVNSDDHPTHRLYPFLNLGEFENSSSVQVVAEKTGKYSYHNHLNASETGTVTVE